MESEMGENKDMDFEKFKEDMSSAALKYLGVLPEQQEKFILEHYGLSYDEFCRRLLDQNDNLRMEIPDLDLNNLNYVSTRYDYKAIYGVNSVPIVIHTDTLTTAPYPNKLKSWAFITRSLCTTFYSSSRRCLIAGCGKLKTAWRSLITRDM